ncbi:Rok-like winged helix domain-containing protein [Collinsella aerofaciens]|uniref:Rok-like winged helix domain-containing protein n=1 Tax=Collinsella aerofaciens TaxID=74426 RepID=UPI001D02F154|nr:hypothetical protein [Collinsella aerofaciens]MCB5366918.1 hypothetical protein [Collinsella aerofaciens]MCB5369020.1 hypothetical protein [Collinsella aerofaciens]
MNVTFSEREAIKKMMDYIESERTRLWDQYIKLSDRLRELDQIERHVNATMEPKVENAVAVVKVKDPEKEEEVNPEGTTVELAEFINNYNKENKNQTIENRVEYDRQKEILKDIDNKKRSVKTPTRRGKYRDVKVITQYIKAILKEAGVPIKTSELIKRLKETGIDVNSPYALIQQAQQYDPRIERAKFGYYQYRG